MVRFGQNMNGYGHGYNGHGQNINMYNQNCCTIIIVNRRIEIIWMEVVTDCFSGGPENRQDMRYRPYWLGYVFVCFCALFVIEPGVYQHVPNWGFI